MVLLGLHKKLGPFQNRDKIIFIIYEIQLSIHFHPPIDVLKLFFIHFEMK
jgi:hypothetical protein